MPSEITHHSAVIEAIGHSGLISELLDTHEGHYKYELDLELIVCGRTYADKRVGPYAPCTAKSKLKLILPEIPGG
jgi:hypothetical protein